MEIIRLNEIDSTHRYLKEYIKNNGYTNPICFFTNYQTFGIGSRGNSWIGKKGNLFFSFVMKKSDLTTDIQMQSISIYFSFILKKILKEYGSKLWLKWPNDFFIKDKKIGGTITTITNELIYCGIGLNLIEVNNEFGYLDIEVDDFILLKDYFKKLEKKISWKQIFSEFRIEFHLSQNFSTNVKKEKISLKDVILNNDGSIQVNNKKVFSLR